MRTTRDQRRAFIKNAKKAWKQGKMSKAEFDALRKDVNNMGKDQHLQHLEMIREQRGVKVISADTIDLDSELVDEDDFAPEDL